MPDERFDILFSGQLLPDQDPATAREKIGRLFKASPAQVERLFSGKPVKVRKAVDLEEASRYRLVFRKLGALVEIRPTAAPAAAASPATPRDVQPPRAPDVTLLPPNTGSLEEFAPDLPPVPLPDISRMHLGNSDTPLDETPAPPPAALDTGDLDLVPGRDWTLEDCQPLPLAHMTPDIDDLELAAPDDTSHIPPEPTPLPLPDISAMQLEEPEPPQQATPDTDTQPKP